MQIAYFQMAGAGKARTQDALFDGVAVHQVKLHKARRVANPRLPLRLAVADGLFAAPAAARASRFWMDAFAAADDGGARFLRRTHPQFCAALAARYFGAATTFASAVFAGGGASVCNVGDSRVYHIDTAGRWRQISHDHTVLAEMIERGEAQAGGDYAGIYGMLAHSLAADWEADDFRIFVTEQPLAAGETLLLCTDGLSDALPHPQLQALWQAHDDLPARLEALRRAVRRVPYFDDCTVVAAAMTDQAGPGTPSGLQSG